MGQQLVPLPAEIQVVPRHQWDRRRVSPRYHCGPATLGRVVTGQPVETHRGWVLNLSTRGTGLLLPQPLAADTLFVLHLKSAVSDRRYELPGRVVHATTQVNGDWLIGCEFADPLSPDDLEALL
jgi:hypothetical protein